MKGIIIFLCLLATSCSTLKGKTKKIVPLFPEKEPEITIEKSRLNRYFYYLAGRWALMEGDVDFSIKCFEEFLRFEPFNTRVMLELASIYFERKKNIEKTYSLLKRAAEIDPQNVELLLSAAEIALAAGDTEGAIKYLTSVLTIDDRNERALIYMGTLHLFKGDIPKAKHYLTKVLTINPSSYIAYYYLAKAALQEKNIEEAKKYYEKATEINPRFREALLELAQLYSITDVDKAITLYSRLLEDVLILSLADIGEIKKRLADLYISKGEYGEALKELEEVENLSPGIDVKWKLGLLYFEMEKWEEALREFEFILTLTPKNEKALLYRALCLLEMEREEEALAEFSKFQPSSSLYEVARFQMAGIYFAEGTEEGKKRGYEILEELRGRGKTIKDVYLVLGAGYREDYRLEEAKGVLGEGFNYYPEDVEMGLLYGAVLEEMGDVEGAIEAAKKLLAIYPEDPDVLNFLGYTYLEYERDIHEAERMLKKALEKKPDAGYIIDSVGFLYYKKGNLQKALHYINLALEKSPDDGEIWEHLGDIYLKMGNLKKAREAYSTALTKKLRKKEEERIRRKLESIKVPARR